MAEVHGVATARSRGRGGGTVATARLAGEVGARGRWARLAGDSEVYSYPIVGMQDENLWTRAHTIYYASTSSPTQ